MKKFVPPIDCSPQTNLLEQQVRERTEKLEFATRQLSALNEVSARFTQIFNEDELLEEVPKLLTQSLDFDRANVLLEKDGSLYLRAFSMVRDTPEMIERFRRRVEAGEMPIPSVFLESFQENKTIFIPDLNKDPRWPKAEGEIIRTRAVVTSPIKAGNKPIGLLIGNMQHHAREMDQDDVVRFEMFANMVGLALENIRAYQNLERKVIERTRELRDANRLMRENTQSLEKTTYSLANANVQLLSVQEQLEKRNSQMAAILDSALSGILMVNHQGQVIAANRRLLSYFDLKADDILQKPVQEFVQRIKKCFADPAQYERHRAELESPLDAEIQRDLLEVYEYSFVICKPKRLVLGSLPEPVTDDNGDNIGRVWVYIDITRLKDADEQMHRIIEASPIPLIVSSISDSKVLFVNHNMAELMGITVEEAKNRLTSDFYQNPDDRRMMIEELEREGSVTNYELPLKRGDGSMIWAMVSVQKSEIGGIPVIIGGINDITQRKEAEVQNKRVLDDLAVAYEHLRETQTQLVQTEKMASLGMLVAGIAHEINTPISAINSMHDTLMRGLEKMYERARLKQPELLEDPKMQTLQEIIQDANKVIVSGCTRVTNIIKRLRSFARLDEAEMKSVNLHEGLEDTLLLIQHELKCIKLVKEYGEIPEIPVFPGRLNQVFLNILMNARQAIPDSGEIKIRTYLKDNKVHIAISDSGVGIPKENLTRLFDPGFTTKGVGVGTGLGLSICYQIIEEHHGDIVVDSKVGEGSTFTIILPTDLQARA